MELKSKKHVLITVDEDGRKIVVIPKIIFKGKRTIDWKEVERYLLKYVDYMVEVAETKDIIYIGKDFPDEYQGSEYTERYKKSSIAKVKANLVQGISELIFIASNKRWIDNKKRKHKKTAKYGWYRYDTRFALPVLSEEEDIQSINIYKAVLIVRYASDKNLYLYDIQNIKKETNQPTMDL